MSRRTSRARRTLVTEPLDDPRPALVHVLCARKAVLEKDGARFPVWQAHLLARLGVTEEEFRSARAAVLVEGADWRFDATNHVVLTLEASEKIATHLGLAWRRPTDGLDVPLRVTKAGPQIRNRRLLQATLEAPCGGLEAGSSVLVFVKDNTLWRPGNAITARHREGTHFDLSSRTPRRRTH